MGAGRLSCWRVAVISVPLRLRAPRSVLEAQQFCCSCFTWARHSTRSLEVQLGVEKNLKRLATFRPRTTFPRGLHGQVYFLRKVPAFLRLAGSPVSRCYGAWYVKEAPLGGFSSVLSGAHTDFGRAKTGKSQGPVAGRDGPAWPSSSWQAEEGSGVVSPCVADLGRGPGGRASMESRDSQVQWLRVLRICDHLYDNGRVVCSCDRLILTLQFFQILCAFVNSLCVSAFRTRACYNIETYKVPFINHSHQDIKWEEF